MPGSNLIVQVTPKEVNSKGFATYYLYGDKKTVAWISLTDPSTIRDPYFNAGSLICNGPCKLPVDWKSRQILLVDSKTKRVFIKSNYDAAPVEITEKAGKEGIWPLGQEYAKEDGEFEASGSGGEGEGGAAPFGLKLPLMDLPFWDLLPNWLLWAGVVNGVYNVDKKFRKNESIGIIGGAGVVLGIYSGVELMNRKKSKQ
jgi:hypothetical protein